MIRVLVADDHAMVRQAMVRALKQEPGIQVVAEASEGPELLAAVDSKMPLDILMLDLRMPDFDFMKVIPQLQMKYPGVRILVVTAWDDRTHIQLLTTLGVEGYLIKGEPLETLVRAVYEVGSGRTYFSQKVMGATLNSAPLTLSQREVQVLSLVAKDSTTEQVAQELSLSSRTVETYVKRACQKLGVSSRSAAVARAVQLGYVTLQD